MVHRFKFLLLLPIAVALGILFVQNQQPLSLKLLCSDEVQSCWYQTPQLPLALWIGLFILAGTITSLIWQLLNRLSYGSSGKKSYSQTNDFERPRSSRDRFTADAETQPDWQYNRASVEEEPQITTATNLQDSSTINKTPLSDYEVLREPEKVERSGSTYSYKFREKSDRVIDESTSTKPDLNKNINTEEEDEDEDWI